MAGSKYDYGVLTFYPTKEAWIISFSSTDQDANFERKAIISAEGVKTSLFQAIGLLGEQGWVVFQVDGYMDRDYPVYHLRRARI